MDISSYKKIACIGIGGTGVFYVAKFFNLLGKEIIGFDIHKNERTEELEKRGAQITYSNPKEPLPKDTDLFIYSPALPNEILEKIQKDNPNIQNLDTGAIIDELISLYKNNTFSKTELIAFEESEIAPLLTFDQTGMKFIGVTGTDGKTSTSTMIYHILKELGYNPGLISTVSAKIGNDELDTGLHTTTPTQQQLANILKLMKDKQCSHVVLETTSHGLAMGRLAGLDFDTVVYTNITTEHLDYHKSWDHYFNSKARLLSEHCSKKGFAVLNADDKKVFLKLRDIAEKNSIQTISYSISSSASMRAEKAKEDYSGISFNLKNQKFNLPILGKYNIYNALAAISAVTTLKKVNLEDISKALSTFKTVKGRMELLQNRPYTVIVDFAHTAFALESALKASTELKVSEENKLIVVFGCAGKRDPTKRIPMGANAGQLADITIVTAEDPRWENLKDINDDIEKGWKTTADEQNQHLIRFDDDTLLTDVRKNAIETALKLAQPGDVVLIAGKAHEQSLCFEDKEHPWNDIEATKKLLKNI